MNEQEKLRQWMGENGYTSSSLAAEVGMNYVSVFRMFKAERALSPGFKLRFIDRFGVDVAGQIFDSSITPSIAQKNGSCTPATAEQT